jgi:hypothetical protein
MRMGAAIKDYFAELADGVGGAWNRFWFRAVDPFSTSVLRIASGLMALLYLCSFNGELTRWFGPQGLLPSNNVRQLTGAASSASEGAGTVFRFSYFYWLEQPVELWIAHVAGLLVVVLFTAGAFTRITSILSVVVIAAYVHRAPMIAGHLEPVLIMVMFYLCIAPSGACLSIDRWRAARREDHDPLQQAAPSVAANIAVRLIQVHLAGFYIIMALSKLAGFTWWTGESMWWLIAHSESRLVDLTSLHEYLHVVNAWTHAVVLFELVFPVLIWNRLARPLLLAVSVVMWGTLALVTGLLAFCAMMVIAGLAFVPPAGLRAIGCRRSANLPAEPRPAESP